MDGSEGRGRSQWRALHCIEFAILKTLNFSLLFPMRKMFLHTLMGQNRFWRQLGNPDPNSELPFLFSHSFVNPAGLQIEAVKIPVIILTIILIPFAIAKLN